MPKIISKSFESLFGWKAPYLPNDLSFMYFGACIGDIQINIPFE